MLIDTEETHWIRLFLSSDLWKIAVAFGVQMLLLELSENNPDTMYVDVSPWNNYNLKRI